MTTAVRVQVLAVFPSGPGGGNPAPIVLDADALTDGEMREVARSYGHESGFVLAPPEGCDVALRFWVPNHEMSMCGHATVAAIWLLDHLGRLPASDPLTIRTASGVVRARVREAGAGERRVEVSQPAGRLDPLTPQGTELVLAALGLTAADLGPGPLGNAATSRVKTIVPIADEARLHRLAPRFDQIDTVCERIGSTGLYPYAGVDGELRSFQARQFPRSSGYPEDAATGIAATALAGALRQTGRIDAADAPVVVRQGFAMGRPSEITVRFAAGADAEVDGVGCWLGGRVTPVEVPTRT